MVIYTLDSVRGRGWCRRRGVRGGEGYGTVAREEAVWLVGGSGNLRVVDGALNGSFGYGMDMFLMMLYDFVRGLVLREGRWCRGSY